MGTHGASYGGDATHAEMQPEVPDMSAELTWDARDSSMGITIEEYEAMDEDTCRDIEIVDGRVVRMPSPTLEHQTIKHNLRAVLKVAAPKEYKVTDDFDVKLRDIPARIRKPDVAVYLRERTAKGMLHPSEVLLAVEIMSPGTISTDRYTKPGEYAEANIPFYWRLEQRADLELHAYKLIPGRQTYQLIGVHTGRYVAAEPFEFDIDIVELLED